MIRDRRTNRQTDRKERERERDSLSVSEREKERDRQKEKEADGDRQKETDRKTEKVQGYMFKILVVTCPVQEEREGQTATQTDRQIKRKTDRHIFCPGG